MVNYTLLRTTRTIIATCELRYPGGACLRLKTLKVTFDQLLEAWKWQPIRNCPGRFVLDARGQAPRPGDLMGTDDGLREFKSQVARDNVLVAAVEGGGLISYRREDGTFVHTLNTPDGFRRKLSQLGIDWPPENDLAAS